jgi:EAL domain-containing protein (putative c-di-GMP-specific phosphodiesterase class I)
LLLVNRFGCDMAQGFFLGKPMPEVDFIAWCAAIEESTNVHTILPFVSGKQQ